jgi:hypothetical protein
VCCVKNEMVKKCQKSKQIVHPKNTPKLGHCFFVVSSHQHTNTNINTININIIDLRGAPTTTKALCSSHHRLHHGAIQRSAHC